MSSSAHDGSLKPVRRQHSTERDVDINPNLDHNELQSMDTPRRLDRNQARLKDLLDANTEQGTWLSARNQDNYAYQRLHK